MVETGGDGFSQNGKGGVGCQGKPMVGQGSRLRTPYLTGKTVAERFHYDYSDGELDEIIGRVNHLAAQADAVHVVFNNNSRDFAPAAAERLRRKLGQTTQSPKRPEPKRVQGKLF